MAESWAPLKSRPKVRARKDTSPYPSSPGVFSDIECHQKTPHVCAVCEEGGDLLFCDGLCMRHFHRGHHSEGAEEFTCPGLDFILDHGDKWLCPDCKLSQAMCFAFHKVGSFEGLNGQPPVVRQCPDPLCIRFFCFTCLPPEKTKCPVHTCLKCMEPETNNLARMVYCMICPRAWHRPCLKASQANGYLKHREIYSHKWSGQVCYMVYCENHVIDAHLGTPVRDHISSAICPPIAGQ